MVGGGSERVYPIRPATGWKLHVLTRFRKESGWNALCGSHGSHVLTGPVRHPYFLSNSFVPQFPLEQQTTPITSQPHLRPSLRATNNRNIESININPETWLMTGNTHQIRRWLLFQRIPPWNLDELGGLRVPHMSGRICIHHDLLWCYRGCLLLNGEEKGRRIDWKKE